MKNLVTLMVVGMLATSATFASGFKCEEVGSDGFSVKLFNHVSGATRTPATLVISSKYSTPATLLVAKGSDIRKSNRANTVRYTVDGEQMGGLIQAILQISFKEGRETIAAGEEVDGQLILVNEDGDREVHKLSCERYLKSN